MANTRARTDQPDALVLSSGDLASFAALLSLRRPDLCVVAPATDDRDTRAVIGKQCDLAGARLADRTASIGDERFAESRRLLDACSLARDEGCARVVWPAWCAGDIDGIAVALERARLVSTLASLDARRGGLAIDTPVLDLTEPQLADLAVDVGVPAERGWFSGDDAPRWIDALRAADARRRQPA